MRNPTILIFANAIILIAAFAMLSQFLFVVPLAAVATRVTGQVALQHGGHGNFFTLSPGSPVVTGDVLRSDENASAEFQWDDGAVLKLMPATEVCIRQLNRSNLKKSRATLLSLKDGHILVHLDHLPRPQSRLQIETPTALATANSTDFTVKVKDGQTQVLVEKGSVGVESRSGGGSTFRLVTANHAATSCFPGEVEIVRPAHGKFTDADLLEGPVNRRVAR